MRTFPVARPGLAAALLAIPLLGPGGLGGGERSGQLVQLHGGHAGQPRVGQLGQRGLAMLGRAAGFADRPRVCGTGDAAGVEGVVPGAVRGVPSSGKPTMRSLADRDAGWVVAVSSTASTRSAPLDRVAAMVWTTT